MKFFFRVLGFTDAFATANELLGWWCKKLMKGVGIKVDFEKTYDRISLAFLDSLMEWWGFDSKWGSNYVCVMLRWQYWLMGRQPTGSKQRKE